MKPSFLQTAILFSLLLLSVASCSRREEITRYDIIRGTWKLQYIGADLNKNSQLDADEVIPLTDTTLEASLVFNPDRSGFASANFQEFPIAKSNFNWGFQNQQMILFTTFGNDTIKSNVERLDNANLVLINSQAGISIWFGFIAERE